MNAKKIFKTGSVLATATLIALWSGAASAQPKPVINPNGSFEGTIDGHLVELPVNCLLGAGFLSIDSHDQTISNSVSIGGVEPALNITGFEKGFQIVVFVGDERYKILRALDTIDAFPYTMAREVKASTIGKIEVDFTVNCPPL